MGHECEKILKIGVKYGKTCDVWNNKKQYSLHMGLRLQNNYI